MEVSVEPQEVGARGQPESLVLEDTSGDRDLQWFVQVLTLGDVKLIAHCLHVPERGLLHRERESGIDLAQVTIERDHELPRV